MHTPPKLKQHPTTFIEVVYKDAPKSVSMAIRDLQPLPRSTRKRVAFLVLRAIREKCLQLQARTPSHDTLWSLQEEFALLPRGGVRGIFKKETMCLWGAFSKLFLAPVFRSALSEPRAIYTAGGMLEHM